MSIDDEAVVCKFVENIWKSQDSNLEQNSYCEEMVAGKNRGCVGERDILEYRGLDINSNS